MSASEDAKELVQEQVDGDMPQEDTKSMPSSQDEEATIKKKYGGILPRKPPLISKDHERAYFDSADWALGKQGAEKPKSPLEALRPKLQVAIDVLSFPEQHPLNSKQDIGNRPVLRQMVKMEEVLPRRNQQEVNDLIHFFRGC